MKKTIFILILITLTLLLSKCKKDEDIPAYVGEWVAIFPTLTADGNDTILVEGKDTYILEKSSYQKLSYVKYNTTFIQSYEEFGSLSVTDKLFTYTVDKFGFSLVNENNHFTGIIDFLDLTAEPIQNRMYSEIYLLEGDELIIYFGDNNQDGDMNDYELNEYVTLLRVK